MKIATMRPSPGERTILLVIRMWVESSEPSGFRARVAESPDTERELQQAAVFGAPEATIAHIAERIRTFAQGELGSHPSP